MRHFTYDITAADNKRLDVFLTARHPEISRAYIQKLVASGQARVNGADTRASCKLKAGDRVELRIPKPAPLQVKAETIDLNIVYEDASFLVIDKPAGMVVHPAPGHSGGTLVNALLGHCRDLAGIGGVERPGIVHRLDKDTSGLVVVAKNDAALHTLAAQFKNRMITKIYLAFVRGAVKNATGVIDAPIGRHKTQRKKMSVNTPRGREAQTRYEVIARFDRFTYVRLYPKTGRTHQIRVHMASLGHPILGDTLYGGKTGPQERPMPRQALHAHRLELQHPVTGKSMIFESPLPPDMADYLHGATVKI